MPGSLAARNISKSYAAVQVLDRVSLVVSQGDRVGIVGPNVKSLKSSLEPASGAMISE